MTPKDQTIWSLYGYGGTSPKLVKHFTTLNRNLLKFVKVTYSAMSFHQ